MALSPPEWNRLLEAAAENGTAKLAEVMREQAEIILKDREEWEGFSTSELLNQLYPVSTCGSVFLVARKRYMYRVLSQLARTVMKPYVTSQEARHARKVFGHKVRTEWRWHRPAVGCCPTCKRPYQ